MMLIGCSLFRRFGFSLGRRCNRVRCFVVRIVVYVNCLLLLIFGLIRGVNGLAMCFSSFMKKYFYNLSLSDLFNIKTN